MLCFCYGIILSLCIFSTFSQNLNGFELGRTIGNVPGVDPPDPLVTQNKFNKMFYESINHILYRYCPDCENDWQHIYYKRLTKLDSFDLYSSTAQWNSADNAYGTDFKLFSTLEDALCDIDTNAWGNHCNYDVTDIGMFNQCGPSKLKTDTIQWAGAGAGAKAAAFYINPNTVITPNCKPNDISVRINDEVFEGSTDSGVTIMNDGWKIRRNKNIAETKWPFQITFPAANFGFQTGQRTILDITVNYDSSAFSGEVDTFWAFDVGHEKYFTFVSDFDGYLAVSGGDTRKGIFIYPRCDSPDVVTGTADTLISEWNEGVGVKWTSIRNALAGNNRNNWYPLTYRKWNGVDKSKNSFKIINKDILNTFEFEFESDSFTLPSLGCQFSSALPTNKDFNLYLSTDVPRGAAKEILKITSIEVSLSYSKREGDIELSDNWSDKESIPRFEHNGPVVSLEGSIAYNDLSKTNWAFGSKGFGYIGKIPAEMDENNDVYTGHYPIANEIFVTINNHGFECSIEVIGKEGKKRPSTHPCGCPQEEPGQLWLRAWIIPDQYFDIDPEKATANMVNTSDVIGEPKKQWCTLDGIVYIARGQNEEDTSATGGGLDFEPRELFISGAMMMLFIGVGIKYASYCCGKCVSRNGNYSKVKMIDSETDEAV